MSTVHQERHQDKSQVSGRVYGKDNSSREAANEKAIRITLLQERPGDRCRQRPQTRGRRPALGTARTSPPVSLSFEITSMRQVFWGSTLKKRDSSETREIGVSPGLKLQSVWARRANGSSLSECLQTDVQLSA